MNSQDNTAVPAIDVQPLACGRGLVRLDGRDPSLRRVNAPPRTCRSRGRLRSKAGPNLPASVQQGCTLLTRFGPQARRCRQEREPEREREREPEAGRCAGRGPGDRVDGRGAGPHPAVIRVRVTPATTLPGPSHPHALHRSQRRTATRASADCLALAAAPRQASLSVSTASTPNDPRSMSLSPRAM
eukprot:scaffold7897_cov403-Prasinococcus_capsulatus_cf.AAC.3